MPPRNDASSVGPLFVAARYDAKESPFYLMYQLRTKYIAALDTALSELDLTAAQWAILRMISERKDNTAAMLCRKYGYDTGYMTRILDRLTAKGLIKRERCSRDRRQVLLALTREGEAQAQAGLIRLVKILNHFLADFDRDDLDIFKSLLRRICDVPDFDPT